MAVALIVAAGRGERLGSGRPKALVPLAGRPLLQWSVDALRAVAEVTQIVIALPADELAEVVRNLATREAEKGLSTGEKQMFTRAKKILASELMYALAMDEDEVEQHIHHLITEVADDDGKVAVAAK